MIFTAVVPQCNLQGVPEIIASLALTKTLALICDIRKGRLSDVPANFTGMGRGSTQEPPRRLIVNFRFLHCCRNLVLFNLFWTSLHLNLPQKVYFALKFTMDQLIFSWQFVRDCFVHV